MSEKDRLSILDRMAGPRWSGPFGGRFSSREARDAVAAIAVESRVRWDYVVPILSLHLLALLAFVPWLFSWTGLIAFVLGVNFFGQLGVPIGYHRLLTHRSFKAPVWLERSFVVLALCCGQNTPARWVSWHRMHHQHS